MNERKRILVAVDEEQNLDLLRAILESFGHESEIAHDGFEALAKLYPSVDLALLGVMRPWSRPRNQLRDEERPRHE